MYNFVYLSVRRSVRNSHWFRDYRDGTGFSGFIWKSEVLLIGQEDSTKIESYQ
jgi:hypothetical protein